MQKNSHHLIPARYLKEFTDPKSPYSKTPYIHYFNSEYSDRIKYKGKKAPSNTKLFTEKNYYSVNDDDEVARTYLEDELASVENKYNLLIPLMVNNSSFNISVEDKGFISLYIALMSTRSEEKGDSFKKISSDSARIVTDMYTSTLDRFKVYIRENNEMNKLSDAELEKTRLKMRKFVPNLEATSEYVNTYRFSAADSITEIINNMRWEFLVPPQNYFFITNDNPVCLNDDRYPKQSVGFKSTPYVNMYFPISKGLCLKASHKKPRFGAMYKKKMISASYVKKINRIIYRWSNKRIYSPSCDISKVIDLNGITIK